MILPLRSEEFLITNYTRVTNIKKKQILVKVKLTRFAQNLILIVIRLSLVKLCYLYVRIF